MTRFPHITTTGLIGGTPKYSVQQLRETFALTEPKEKTILLTFGGLGLSGIPYHALEEFPDYQFITFDRQAPSLENLCKITNVAYRPVDFMPLCDHLVSKPGFGTFAEAMLQDLPIATLPRNDFAEGIVLLEGLKTYSRHQIIDPKTFAQGNLDFLREAPQPPTDDRPIDKTGVEAIATEIVNYLSKI
jgi:hypothetical protein